MDFFSISFLCIFVPIFLGINYIIPKKYRNIWLLIGSVILLLGRISFLLYSVLITLFTYLNMLFLSKLPKQYSKKKWTHFVILLQTFLFLIFTFYGNRKAGYLYPICYTVMYLQNIATLLDFVHKKEKLPPSLFHYFVYSLSFTKLMIGPVISFYDMKDTIYKREESKEKFVTGSFTFLKGIIQNILLVQPLLQLKQQLMMIPVSMVGSWLLLFVTAISIILFFMSCSDMFFGLSTMLGIYRQKEFEYPLCCFKMSRFFSYWNRSISIFLDKYCPIFQNKLPFFIELLLFALFFSFIYGIHILFLLWAIFIAIGILIQKKIWKSKQVSILFSMIWILLSFVFFIRPNELVFTITSLFSFKNPFYHKEVGYWFSSFILVFILSFLSLFPLHKMISEKTRNKDWYQIVIIIIYFVLLMLTLLMLVEKARVSIWPFQI